MVDRDKGIVEGRYKHLFHKQPVFNADAGSRLRDKLVNGEAVQRRVEL